MQTISDFFYSMEPIYLNSETISKEDINGIDRVYDLSKYFDKQELDEEIKTYSKLMEERNINSQLLLVADYDLNTTVSKRQKRILKEDKAFFKKEIKQIDMKLNKLNLFIEFNERKQKDLDTLNNLLSHVLNPNILIELNTIIDQYNRDYDILKRFMNSSIDKDRKDLYFQLQEIVSKVSFDKIDNYIGNFNNIINIINTYNIKNNNTVIFKKFRKKLNTIKAFYNATVKNLNHKNDKDSGKNEKYPNDSKIDDYIFLTPEKSEPNVGINNISERKNNKQIVALNKGSKWSKIKKSILNGIKRVAAGLLAVITIGSVSTISKVGDNDQNESSIITNFGKDDSKLDKDKTSNIDIIKSTKPVVYETNNIEQSADAGFNSDELSINDNFDNQTVIEDDEITIGKEVSISEEVYYTAKNAYYETNVLTLYNDLDDSRIVSLIAYKNSDEDIVVINEHNQDKIEELKKLKYEICAYAVDNKSQNLQYEAWCNKDTVKVLKK